MNVTTRLKEYTKTPAKLHGARGDFFNEVQCRLERRDGIQVACWHSVESLIHLSKLPEASLKNVIANSPDDMRDMLSNFFFSGWKLNYYLRTGKRPEFG